MSARSRENETREERREKPLLKVDVEELLSA
jgi:hypothetical protein